MLLVPITPPAFAVDLSIAYAGPDNFTGAPVYGRAACYLLPEAADCLGHAIAAAGLNAAAVTAELRAAQRDYDVGKEWWEIT